MIAERSELIEGMRSVPSLIGDNITSLKHGNEAFLDLLYMLDSVFVGSK